MFIGLPSRTGAPTAKRGGLPPRPSFWQQSPWYKYAQWAKGARGLMERVGERVATRARRGDIPGRIAGAVGPLVQAVPFQKGFIAGREELPVEETRRYVGRLGKVTPEGQLVPYETEQERRIGKELGAVTMPTLGAIKTPGFKAPPGILERGISALRGKTPTPEPPLGAATRAGKVPAELFRREVTPEEDSIQRIMAIVKKAKPKRAKQALLRTKTRGGRLAAGLAAEEEAIARGVGYREAFGTKLEKMGGELPRVGFEPVEAKALPGDIQNLFKLLKESPKVNEWDKFPIKEGLEGLLKGQIPTRGQALLMKKVYGEEFVKTLIEKRALSGRLFEEALIGANVPRTAMTVPDMSLSFRQALYFIGHPRYWKDFLGQVKYFMKEDLFQASQNEIMSHPNFEMWKDAGRVFTQMGGEVAGQEEPYMGSEWIERLGAWLQKRGWIGRRLAMYPRLVRASNRAWTGLANRLRADISEDMLDGARQARTTDSLINRLFGIKLTDIPPEQDTRLLESISSLVNVGTGRGELGALSKAAPILNAAFFSPRLWSARVTLLNPLYYYRLEPYVRKEALKTFFKTAGILSSVLGLAVAAGAEVGTELYSPDFGKIKIGNTRVDIFGGFQQYLVKAAQIAKGVTVSSTTGKVRRVGEGYPELTRKELIYRFLEGKEAPIPSLITALMTGKTWIGEDVNIPKEVADRFTPMVLQDILDLYKEWGAGRMLMLGILAWFGVGLQTYGPRPTKPKPRGKIYVPQGGLTLPK